MTNQATAEDRLRASFPLFLALVWKSLDLPRPTRAQIAIATYLQNGPKRLQISAFRGLGKSWIAAAFALWILYRDRDKKIMVVSASKQRADDFTIFCQKCLIEIPWLQHLTPKDDDQRWSRVSFDVYGCRPAQSPSVKSVGITGQITGSRADVILFDDVEVPSNSATDMMREKLLQLVTEGESVLTPRDDSRIVFLGTPQTTFTIYRTLRERNYLPMVWPARYPKTLVGYEDILAPELQADIDKQGLEALAWKPTDTRFSELNLLEREQSMSRSNFMLQFQLDTSLSDAQKFPLKIADIIALPLDGNVGPSSLVWRTDKSTLLDLPCVALPGDRWYGPQETGPSVPFGETIVAVDPSGRGKDETVALVLSQINGNLRASFPLFLALVWKSLDLPRPTRAQIAIATYLQNGPKRLQISAFRGLGKSWIAAAFALWILYRDKDKKDHGGVCLQAASRRLHHFLPKVPHRDSVATTPNPKGRRPTVEPGVV
jgi:hypothetical protein